MSNQGKIRSRQGSFIIVYSIIVLSIIIISFLVANLAYNASFFSIYNRTSLAVSVTFMLCAAKFGLYGESL
jgi:hypothetical protein